MASVLRTLRHRKAPSELPSFDCMVDMTCSVGSDDSQSSSSWEEDEMLFNCRIPENFPLYRSTHEQRVEARRSMLIKVLVVLSVLGIVALNFSHTLGLQTTSRRHKSKHQLGRGWHSHSQGRRLTAESEQLMSLADNRKIQETSLRLVEDRFGAGPHLVEFEIKIWGEDNQPEQKRQH